jgi:5-methylcytosine-specific restriction endonuclease McrA
MPYSAYLETDHWQAVRARALRRAGRRCQICGARGRLDVHHNTYVRRGRELNSDVVALCRDCHDLYHGHGALPEPKQRLAPPTVRATGRRR